MSEYTEEDTVVTQQLAIGTSELLLLVVKSWAVRDILGLLSWIQFQGSNKYSIW